MDSNSLDLTPRTSTVSIQPPPLPPRTSTVSTQPPLELGTSTAMGDLFTGVSIFDGCCDDREGCATVYLRIMSKNSVSYPLWHGILIGFLFMFNLISGGLFFVVGVDSEEYKVADSVDQLLRCRWKSLGMGASAAISMIAMLISMIPAIVSFLLVKNSPEDCRSAFKVKRYEEYFDEVVSVENIDKVRSISLSVKMSYIYTGIPLIFMTICLTCTLISTILSSVVWVFFIYFIYSAGLELPTNGSRLNNVLSPPGGYRCYAGLFLALIGIGVDDSNSPMIIPMFIILFITIMALDFPLPFISPPTTSESVTTIVDSLETVVV